MLGISSSPKTLLCLLVVIFGFFLGSSGELNFSLKGTIAGVLSSLFVSLNSIFTKKVGSDNFYNFFSRNSLPHLVIPFLSKVLPVVDDNHWRLTFYNNMNASILFIPLIM